jgi:dTDP-glucose 4,6-dehydratase
MAKIKKRVLITGGNGFAGFHFVEYALKTTDWEIISLDSFRHMGDSQKAVRNKRVTYFTHDCATPIGEVLDKRIGHVDYVVNMAAQSHVDRSIDDPRGFIYNNTQIATEIALWAVFRKVEKFLQVSTDEVYGAAPVGYDHKEWDKIIPSNPYSASKACQEAVVISFWRTYSLPLIITNCMNLIGERQHHEKFVPMVIKNIQRGNEVTIHGNQKFIGMRKYLHAKNHAAAILHLLQLPSVPMFPKADMPMRVNVVGDVEMNNLEMAEYIAKLMGKKLKYRLVDFHSARPGHDPRYSLDGSLLKKIGFTHPIPFEKAMKETIKWFKKNGEWL